MERDEASVNADEEEGMEKREARYGAPEALRVMKTKFWRDGQGKNTTEEALPRQSTEVVDGEKTNGGDHELNMKHAERDGAAQVHGEGNGSDRRLSDASVSSLLKLESYEKQLKESERILYAKGTESMETLVLQFTRDLLKLKNKLETMNGALEKLQDSGIDSVMTSGLISGKDQVRQIRKTLNQRAAGAMARLKQLHAQISTILEGRREPNRDLRVLVTTWNIGNKAPSPEIIRKWLPEVEGGFDLIVIGLQECEYELSAEMREQAYVAKQQRRDDKKELNRRRTIESSNSGTPRNDVDGPETEDPVSENGLDLSEYQIDMNPQGTNTFRLRVENGLKKTINTAVGMHFYDLVRAHLGRAYSLVRESELAQMRLFVIAHRKHLHAIQDLRYASQATGIANVGPNKGGVAVSMILYGLKLAFISCHLAAHKRNVRARNENMSEIIRSLDKRFGSKHYNMTSEFDHIFVLGDLNYRLDLSYGKDASAQNCVDAAHVNGGLIPAMQRMEEDRKADSCVEDWNTVSQLVANSKWEELMAIDQLTHEMERNRVLTSFHEGKIAFKPTFKVERGVVGPIYVHTRLPSFCDRILWYSIPGREKHIFQESLLSCNEATSSDHKPVISCFRIQLGETVIKPVSQDRGLEMRRPSVGFAFKSGSKKQEQATHKDPRHPEKGVMLRITNLSATDMIARDIDGQSDPYVVFCSPNLFGTKQDGFNPAKGAGHTPVLKHRLNAKWKNSDIPIITLPKELDNFESLAQRHLILALWDRDLVTRDDTMGQAVLGMDMVLSASRAELDRLTSIQEMQKFEGPPVHFHLPILVHGHKHGSIEGDIQLLGPRWTPSSRRTLMRSAGHMNPTSCCKMS